MAQDMPKAGPSAPDLRLGLGGVTHGPELGRGCRNHELICEPWYQACFEHPASKRQCIKVSSSQQGMDSERRVNCHIGDLSLPLSLSRLNNSSLLRESPLV